MNKKRIILLLIILNLIIIIFLRGFILTDTINIEYKNFKKPLVIKFESEGNYPYLFKTHNNTIILVFSKFNETNNKSKLNWDIFYTFTNEGKMWSNIKKLTNGSSIEKSPLIVQHNESTIRLYYNSFISKEITDWYFIETQDLHNWTYPKISNRPIIDNTIWSEIDVPDFFKDAKKYKGQYSLIKNYNEEYMLLGIHDESSSIGHSKPSLFITISKNGKDWEMPIKLVNETISNPNYSFIENDKGNYSLVYHTYENFKNKIKITNFTDSDLERTTESVRIFYHYKIADFFNLIIIILIINVIFILIIRKIK